MPGILREVAEHALKIRPSFKLVKRRHFNKGKRRAIGKEIAKLLAAGFIKEVYHPEWLVWQNLLNYRAHMHLSLSNDL